MKKLSLLILSLLPLTSLTAFTQTIQLNVPDPSVDYHRLARIDTFVNSYIQKGWMNGVVTLVKKDGHVINTRDMDLPIKNPANPCAATTSFAAHRRQRLEIFYWDTAVG